MRDRDGDKMVAVGSSVGSFVVLLVMPVAVDSKLNDFERRGLDRDFDGVRSLVAVADGVEECDGDSVDVNIADTDGVRESDCVSAIEREPVRVDEKATSVGSSVNGVRDGGFVSESVIVLERDGSIEGETDDVGVVSMEGVLVSVSEEDGSREFVCVRDKEELSVGVGVHPMWYGTSLSMGY